jgi:hypothetical protein
VNIIQVNDGQRKKVIFGLFRAAINHVTLSRRCTDKNQYENNWYNNHRRIFNNFCHNRSLHIHCENEYRRMNTENCLKIFGRFECRMH